MKRELKKLLQPYVAETLKRNRKRLGLTQEKIAEKLHITPESCSRIENGKQMMSAVPFILLMLLSSEEELLYLFRGARACLYAVGYEEYKL